MNMNVNFSCIESPDLLELTYQWMPNERKMDANLMWPPRFDFNLFNTGNLNKILKILCIKKKRKK